MADSVQVTYEKGKLYDLAIADLQPDPEQPRKYFDEQALAELKASIEKHGVLQPVLVRQGADGVLLIVSGERRYQASKLAGCATILAIFTDGDPVEISIVENLLRENLTAIEEAEAIDRLKTQHNYQLSELSTILGKSDSTLSEILSLTKLPEEVKSDCRNDPKTARGILAAIAKQKDPAKMTALYAKYKESGLTRGEILKKTRKPKAADAPIDLGFINVFTDKMEAVDLTKLDQAQRETMQVDLKKTSSSVLQIITILKG
jgi:ParB family chromosome partitioning protein